MDTIRRGVRGDRVRRLYGSKAGLAVSLVDSADSRTDVQPVLSELAKASGDPAGQLAALVGFDRRLFEDGATCSG